MKRTRFWVLPAVVVLLGLLSTSYGQSLFGGISGDVPEIPVKVIPSHTALAPGDDGIVAVILEIPGGYHIQDDLDVVLEDMEGITQGELIKPKGTFKEEYQTVFFYNRPHFAVRLKVDENAGKGQRNVRAKVRYSPCTESLCFGPKTETVVFTIDIADEKKANPVFAEIQAGLPETLRGETPEPEEEEVSGLEGRLTHALARGSWIAFVLVFLGGILTSFTPCVYPMIPITVSYFGTRASGSLARGFFMSVMYVLGIVITYSILGVIAGATGAAFGSFAENPAVIVIIVLIFLALAASMFGAFELQLPAALRGRLAMGPRKTSVLGPLFLGLVLGLVAAPCIGPVLLAILAYVSQEGSVIYGFWLMFFFACGMGLLFIVIGTFSGAIEKLPKSGAWMLTVKKVFGALMVAMAIFYARPLLPASIYGYVVAVALVVFGTFAGAFVQLPEKSSPQQNIRKVVAIIAVVAGIYGLVTSMIASGLFMPPGSRIGPATAESTGPATAESIGLEIDWNKSFDRAIEKAKAGNKPLMVDFYSKNCPACIEMDNRTYTDRDVIDASKKFVAAKLYQGHYKDLVREYRIQGYPAVVFLNPDGTQIGKTAYGFIKANKFIKLMDNSSKGF